MPPLQTAGSLGSMWRTQHRTQRGHAGDHARRICNVNTLVNGWKSTPMLVGVTLYAHTYQLK